MLHSVALCCTLSGSSLFLKLSVSHRKGGTRKRSLQLTNADKKSLAIENSLSNDFLPTFVNCIYVYHCRLFSVRLGLSRIQRVRTFGLPLYIVMYKGFVIEIIKIVAGLANNSTGEIMCPASICFIVSFLGYAKLFILHG